MVLRCIPRLQGESYKALRFYRLVAVKILKMINSGRYFFEKRNKCITMALIRRIRTGCRSKDEKVNDFGCSFIGVFGYVERVFFGGIQRVPVSTIHL